MKNPYPRRTSICLSDEDYEAIEQLSKDKYKTTVSSTIRFLIHKALTQEKIK